MPIFSFRICDRPKGSSMLTDSPLDGEKFLGDKGLLQFFVGLLIKNLRFLCRPRGNGCNLHFPGFVVGENLQVGKNAESRLFTAKE